MVAVGVGLLVDAAGQHEIRGGLAARASRNNSEVVVAVDYPYLLVAVGVGVLVAAAGQHELGDGVAGHVALLPLPHHAPEAEPRHAVLLREDAQLILPAVHEHPAQLERDRNFSICSSEMSEK